MKLVVLSYDSEILGVFTNEKKAEEAKAKFLKIEYFQEEDSDFYLETFSLNQIDLAFYKNLPPPDEDDDDDFEADDADFEDEQRDHLRLTEDDILKYRIRQLEKNSPKPNPLRKLIFWFVALLFVIALVLGIKSCGQIVWGWFH